MFKSLGYVVMSHPASMMSHRLQQQQQQQQ